MVEYEYLFEKTSYFGCNVLLIRVFIPAASACVRDSMEDLLEADPSVAKLTNAPSVSIVEKKARVVRWVMSINKSLPISSNSPRSSRRAPELPVIPPRPQTNARIASSAPPPIPPRGKPQHSLAVKESDV